MIHSLDLPGNLQIRVAAISDLLLLYNSRRVAPGKTQVGGDLGMHPPRKPLGLCTQWTATDHIKAPPPCPCTSNPPQRAEIGGQWSQPVPAADWHGSIPPMTCQQQPRLNYKRRVGSAHRKGAPQVPSLSDRGGCVTGPYRTTTTSGHTAKTQSQSSST